MTQFLPIMGVFFQLLHLWWVFFSWFATGRTSIAISRASTPPHPGLYQGPGLNCTNAPRNPGGWFFSTSVLCGCSPRKAPGGGVLQYIWFLHCAVEVGGFLALYSPFTGPFLLQKAPPMGLVSAELWISPIWPLLSGLQLLKVWKSKSQIWSSGIILIDFYCILFNELSKILKN